MLLDRAVPSSPPRHPCDLRMAINMVTISLDPHPLLDVACFLTEFPQSLSSMPSPESIARLWSAEATAPWQSSDAIRAAIRSLLR